MSVRFERGECSDSVSSEVERIGRFEHVTVVVDTHVRGLGQSSRFLIHPDSSSFLARQREAGTEKQRERERERDGEEAGKEET